MRTVLARAADGLADEPFPSPVNLLTGEPLLRRVAGRRPLPGELAINDRVTARR